MAIGTACDALGAEVGTLATQGTWVWETRGVPSVEIEQQAYGELVKIRGSVSPERVTIAVEDAGG